MFRDCRDRAGAVRGAAAGARPGHAARGHLQREGGEARHQGARAHQAAPQGEPGGTIVIENLMNTFKIFGVST